MNVELVKTAEQAQAWDRFVVSQPHGAHVQLTWWMRNQHVPLLTTSVLAACEAGRIVGGAVLYHFSPFRLAGDVTIAPHSPLADAYRPDIVRAVLDAVVSYCRRRRSLLVQFEAFAAEILDPLREATRGMTVEENAIWKLYHPGIWRDLRVLVRDRSDEEILKSFSATTRNMVRQGIRRGFEVVKCQSEADLRIGYKVWREAARQNEYTQRPWDSFARLHEIGTARDMAWAHLCRMEGRPLGFSSYAASGRGFDQIVLAHRPVPEAGPVARLLCWHGIVETKSRGMDYLSFGAPMRGGNARFKESFSPLLVDHTRFITVILRKHSVNLGRRWLDRPDWVIPAKRWIARLMGGESGKPAPAQPAAPSNGPGAEEA